PAGAGAEVRVEGSRRLRASGAWRRLGAARSPWQRRRWPARRDDGVWTIQGRPAAGEGTPSGPPERPVQRASSRPTVTAQTAGTALPPSRTRGISTKRVSQAIRKGAPKPRYAQA